MEPSVDAICGSSDVVVYVSVLQLQSCSVAICSSSLWFVIHVGKVMEIHNSAVVKCISKIKH
jgi:hypothetical protein